MTIVTKISDANAVANAGATGLCAGANLRTPCGPRRVENFRPGDLIVTRDNGLQPVKMIWARTVTAKKIAADPSLAPVVLRPRAVGPMMPQQTLSVGGAHRLLIPGWRLEDEDDAVSCLVPARDIAGLNDSAFVDRATEEVTYYNVVFDEHQVFCANGLPVESFSPKSEAIKDVPRDVKKELTKTFPELGPKFKGYPAPRYKLRERVSYSPDFA
ncbi:MAG: Hint domain-containing protein [Boseongicola sp.]|nr:Hint domain-containing protein [Boseongicola sp.]MDD9979635.1 Hint domain-containing protein [Boseongicola sp.]